MTKTKRLLVIACSVAIAVPLAIYTLPKRAQRTVLPGDFEQLNGDAGGVIVKRQPSIREKYASMVAAARENPPDQWLRDFELTEQDGQRLRSQDLRGAPYIASFFFSTCPSVCVLQNDQVRLLQERFRDKPIKFVSISVDPEVDTPEVLTEYAKRMGAIKDRWYFLTGDFDYIQRVSTEMFFHPLPQVRFHQERFFLVDGDGKLVGGYQWSEPGQLKLLEEHVREILPTR